MISQCIVQAFFCFEYKNPGLTFVSPGFLFCEFEARLLKGFELYQRNANVHHVC